MEVPSGTCVHIKYLQIYLPLPAGVYLLCRVIFSCYLIGFPIDKNNGGKNDFFFFFGRRACPRKACAIYSEDHSVPEWQVPQKCRHTTSCNPISFWSYSLRGPSKAAKDGGFGSCPDLLPVLPSKTKIKISQPLENQWDQYQFIFGAHSSHLKSRFLLQNP